MNSILFTGIHGHPSPGFLLTFVLIGIFIYSFESWKKRKQILPEGGTSAKDRVDWKLKMVLTITALVSIMLPFIRSLIEQNRVGVIRREAYQGNAFEGYSMQVLINLFLFVLVPFFISSIIVMIKKEFPTRIFINLVVISMVFFSFVFILFSFQQR